MQKKKGISLIVLVITIIVMTILAGAVIISLENTGMVKQSKQAKNKTNYAQELTRLEVLKNGVLTDNLGKITLAEYVAELTNKGVIEGTPVNNADGSVTVTTTSGTEVKLTQDGQRNILIEIAGYTDNGGNTETKISIKIYDDLGEGEIVVNPNKTWKEAINEGIIANMIDTLVDSYTFEISGNYIIINDACTAPVSNGELVSPDDKLGDYEYYIIGYNGSSKYGYLYGASK